MHEPDAYLVAGPLLSPDELARATASLRECLELLDELGLAYPALHVSLGLDLVLQLAAEGAPQLEDSEA